MERTNENQDWAIREAIRELGGLIASYRGSDYLYHLWRRTGDLSLIRHLLEFEIQTRPELRALLERVHEIQKRLVTQGRIVETDPSFEFKSNEPWIQHLELLHHHELAVIWVFVGTEGVGKTSTVRGVIEELKKQLGWKSTSRPSETACEILFLDDAGSQYRLTKRDWQGERGRELLRFLRAIRRLFTLTLLTAPDIEDLDISIRESKIGETIRVVRPGFASWREPIVVLPIWEPEPWRQDIAESFEASQSTKK